jgi:hypothetical protein
MLNHSSHDSHSGETLEVTISLHVHEEGGLLQAPRPNCQNSLTSAENEAVCNITQRPCPFRAMATSTERLECPMCSFTVPSIDDYVLQLHFEQVHTTDSPFRIVEDDPEPLPPTPSAPSYSTLSKHVLREEAASDSGEEENSVLCPEPDCCELIPLAEFNDHLDYHSAETLSFDEATGKYHSHQPASIANMHVETAAMGRRPAGPTKQSFVEQHSTTSMPDALKRNQDITRKLKKQYKHEKSDSAGSEKSTLSRSIHSFNPFTKNDKQVVPPKSNCRLGVSTLFTLFLSVLPSSALLHLSMVFPYADRF